MYDDNNLKLDLNIYVFVVTINLQSKAQSRIELSSLFSNNLVNIISKRKF